MWSKALEWRRCALCSMDSSRQLTPRPAGSRPAVLIAGSEHDRVGSYRLHDVFTHLLSRGASDGCGSAVASELRHAGPGICRGVDRGAPKVAAFRLALREQRSER